MIKTISEEMLNCEVTAQLFAGNIKKQTWNVSMKRKKESTYQELFSQVHHTFKAFEPVDMKGKRVEYGIIGYKPLSEMELRHVMDRLRTGSIAFIINQRLCFLNDKFDSAVGEDEIMPWWVRHVRIQVRGDPETDGDMINVVIRTLAGKSLSLRVKSTWTFHRMKELIQEKDGTPPDQQRLMFKGAQLDDDSSLSDHDVKDDSVLCMVLRLQGGMYLPVSSREGYEGLLRVRKLCSRVATINQYSRNIDPHFNLNDEGAK